jgi:hypothetical protein
VSPTLSCASSASIPAPISPHSRLIHRVLVGRDAADADGAQQALNALAVAERATRHGGIILEVHRPQSQVRTIEITTLISVVQLVELMFDEVQHELATNHGLREVDESATDSASAVLASWIDHTETSVRAAALPRFALLLIENGVQRENVESLADQLWSACRL